MARLRAKYRKSTHGKEVIQTFIAEFYDRNRHPRLKRVSLGTRDKSAALQKFARLEREYMAGLRDPWTDPVDRDGMLVSEATEAFVKSREGRSEKTITNYTDILHIFCESLPPGMMIRAVEARHVDAFLNGRDLKATSRRTYVRHLSVFFRWCLKEGLMQHDPTPIKDRNRKKETRRVAEFLTEVQYEELIRTIEAVAVLKGRHAPDGGRWITDVIRLAVGTGLRRGEICNLRWSSVDLHNKLVKVQNTDDFRTKSGHERSVPLVGEALRVVERLAAERTGEVDDFVFKGIKGGKLNGRHLTRRFCHYRRQARLPEDISLHSLRHTFASWWVLRGGDLYRLKEVLGHADIQTTMIYAHLRPEALREEMEKCFGTGYAAKEHTGAEAIEIERLRAQVALLKAGLEGSELLVSLPGSQRNGR